FRRSDRLLTTVTEASFGRRGHSEGPNCLAQLVQGISNDRVNRIRMTRKCGRTRPFLTGFQFGGIKLKDRSAGGWRSGRLALREVMAAGARFIACLPTSSSALLVPRPLKVGCPW